MTNRILVAGAALIALGAVSPAVAADMSPAPFYKAPAMLPSYNWTGLYIGANIGGSFGNADTSVAFAGAGVATPSFNMDGVVGGGQIGYNLQTGSWIWGIEADFQGTSQSGSGAASQTGILNINAALIPVTGNLAYSEKLPWFGTVRGRLGFTPADRWFLYATGGLAYGEVDTNSTLTVGPTSAGTSFSNTKTGWTVGAGVEAALWGKWTGKLEYLYVDLGSVNNSFTGLSIFTPVTISSHVTDNIVRVGLNYRF